MGLFRKKPDLIRQKERQLKERIAALEGEIQHLNHKLDEDQAQPKVRSTALPHQPGAAKPSPPAEPAFEELSQFHAHGQAPSESTTAHYNELGVRKYDLMTTLRRWFNHFKSPTPPSSRLVDYLAAGSIHGLRPLRYEKRVARNRFLVLCAFFIAVLWGLIYFWLRNR
jgi:hypothetical protein